MSRFGLYRSGGKRLFDICLAGFGLLLFALPIAFITWKIRRESRLSFIFRQPRIGLRGREFVILKFRTMSDELPKSLFFDELIGFRIVGRPLPQMVVFAQSLRIVPGAQTQMLVSDEPGLRTVMIGQSSTTNSSEVVWVVTRIYYQSLFYMVFVAPEDEFPMYQSIFEQIIRSARLR